MGEEAGTKGIPEPGDVSGVPPGIGPRRRSQNLTEGVKGLLVMPFPFCIPGCRLKRHPVSAPPLKEEQRST
jgi:hypothetical protein